MRKLLNKLLIKFGLLITKAPTLLADQSLATSDAFPVELTEKVSVREATDTPENELFDIFSADTNVHKWHHYFDICTKHFEAYFDRKESNFRHEHAEALQQLDLSYLSANLASIAFYDSIVVFDKKNASCPNLSCASKS